MQSVSYVRDGKVIMMQFYTFADKIEPLRGYDASKEWEVSRISLQKGSTLCASESKSIYFKNGGKKCLNY